MLKNKTFCALLATATGFSLASCGFRPSTVHQPTIDAAQAGSTAIEQFDKNGDGKLSGVELDGVPGLKAALARVDTDGDGAVTADEIGARVNVWHKMQTGLTSFEFAVTLDGVPLTDATVTFEPETFLGEQLKSAAATTNNYGRGGASIPKEQRPDPTWPPGVQIGLYRVRISKLVNGRETIPAKYNAHTVLGQEVAPDVSEIANRSAGYALTSKWDRRRRPIGRAELTLGIRATRP